MGPIFQIILQRLALGVITLLIVSMVIFVAVNALPGDFAQAILGPVSYTHLTLPTIYSV